MGKLEFPQRIAVELTPLCNLSCTMCPRHYISDMSGYMSKELWKKIIDEISEVAPEAVVLPFWRGESLLHPDFSDLLEYALSKSLRIHISTNGLLLEGRFAEILSRCEFVNVSAHTPRGLNYARAFTNSLKSKKTNRATVQVSFVSGEKTTSYIEDILQTSDLEGFDCVRLYEMHSSNGIFGSIGTKVNGLRTYCPKLLDTFVIAYDGSVSRCSHIWNPENGPNLNLITIKEAWESEVMEQIRKSYPDAQCGSCDQWIGRTLGLSWIKKDGAVIQEKIWPANEFSFLNA